MTYTVAHRRSFRFAESSAGKSVFLDIFGVTPQGKLVLIECKLWRNPQARREVIAQILEYASLLSKWSYGDLSARLSRYAQSDNPLYTLASQHAPDITEATFVDAVSKSLRTGDFILIIAGDGIRSDVHAIADHLNQSSGLTSHMALVEFQLWEGETGEVVVVPSIPLRTELVQHCVFVNEGGQPIQFSKIEKQEDTEMDAIVNPEKSAMRETERAFWESFISNVKFDHPDQPKPRHGGHAWIKLELPDPAGWMTGYRTQNGRAGFFFTLKGDDGELAFAEIEAAQQQLLADMNPLSFTLAIKKEQPFEGTVSFDYDGDAHNDALLSEWLHNSANTIVNTFRPFLGQIAQKISN
jgi:hypothetical protein